MKRKGFTLIELLVVIAIIALLLAVILPSMGLAKATAKRLVCETRQASLGKAIFLYAENNNGFLPPSAYKTGNGAPHSSYGIAFITRDASLGPKERMDRVVGWGYLFTSDLIEDGEVFYCPNAPKHPEGQNNFAVSWNYQSYNGGPGWPWNNDPSGWNNYYVRAGYQYLPQAVRTKVTVEPESFPEIATKATQLYVGHVMACDILYTLEHLPHKKGGGKHAGGVNALYGDGSVAYTNNPEAFDRKFWPEGFIANDEYRFRKVVSLLK